jgi:hypothetical protein
MVGWYTLFRRQVTKQVAALLVVYAHALAPLKKGAPIVVRPNRPVDLVASVFDILLGAQVPYVGSVTAD